jgi:hypothetical protein
MVCCCDLSGWVQIRHSLQVIGLFSRENCQVSLRACPIRYFIVADGWQGNETGSGCRLSGQATRQPGDSGSNPELRRQSSNRSMKSKAKRKQFLRLRLRPQKVSDESPQRLALTADVTQCIFASQKTTSDSSATWPRSRIRLSCRRTSATWRA